MDRKLTIENVLARVDQLDVMERFFESKIIFGKRYVNPFRSDKSPGCWFSWRHGVLMFNDYGSRYFGDCIAICSYRLGVSLPQALTYLNIEYNLGLGYDNDVITNVAPIINIIEPYDLDSIIQTRAIRYQRYSDFSDDDYFYQYHITKKTLNKYKVYPCEKVWVETKNGIEVYQHSNSQPIYVYDFGSDKYKVYRPLANKKTKWRSNCKELQGFTGLTDDLVIRTSSLKDVMVLEECGYLADAPHSETSLAMPRNNMVLLYDNDGTGITTAQLHSEHYGCPYIVLPEVYVNQQKLKDPSDFAKVFGLEYLKSLVNNLLNGVRTTNAQQTRYVMV